AAQPPARDRRAHAAGDDPAARHHQRAVLQRRLRQLRLRALPAALPPGTGQAHRVLPGVRRRQGRPDRPEGARGGGRRAARQLRAPVAQVGGGAARRQSLTDLEYRPGMLSRRTAWIVAIAATLTMTVSYIDRQALAVLSVAVTKDLDISREQYG